MPGAPHVGSALINGVETKELEVLVGESKYLMDAFPLRNGQEIDSVLVTYCNINSIRHFVILETISGSMREGVNIVDEKGILRYTNPSSARYANVARAEDMIGYPKFRESAQ